MRRIIALRFGRYDHIPFVRNSMLNDILKERLKERIDDRLTRMKIEHIRLGKDICDWKSKRDELYLGKDILELCRELGL